MKSKTFLLVCIVLACVTCTKQDSSLAVVRVSASASGQLVITAEAQKIAVANSQAQNLEVISIPGSASGATYTYAEWSPSGKQLALTRVEGTNSSILIFSLDSKHASIVPNTKTDRVVRWLDEDQILVLRASSFRSPDQLLGPDYAKPESYVLLNPRNGRVSSYQGEFDDVSYPKSLARRGEWRVDTLDKDNPFEFRIHAYYRGKQVFVTKGNKYRYGVSLSDASVFALQDNDGDFQPRLVSVSLATGKEQVLMEANSIRKLFESLK